MDPVKNSPPQGPYDRRASAGAIFNGVEWAHEHPYLSALIAAAAFLVFGTLIVGYRTAQPQSGDLQVWGGAPDAFLDATSYEPGSATFTETQVIGSGNVPPFSALTPSKRGDAQSGEGSGFDMSAFVAALSGQNTADENPPASGSLDLSLSYTFIPSGLVATTTKGPRRSELQESLYQYGNDVSSHISTFEDGHMNAGQVLTDQLQDRQNPQKAQAVRNIGMALQETGKNLQRMEQVPSVVSAAHAALAKSYINAGIQLAKVPEAQGDNDFLAAIQAYNTTADQLGRDHVVLANIFAGAGVTFAPSDPGSVFSFSGGTGL